MLLVFSCFQIMMCHIFWEACKGTSSGDWQHMRNWSRQSQPFEAQASSQEWQRDSVQWKKTRKFKRMNIKTVILWLIMSKSAVKIWEIRGEKHTQLQQQVQDRNANGQGPASYHERLKLKRDSRDSLARPDSTDKNNEFYWGWNAQNRLFAWIHMCSINNKFPA
jgi:hypothetical protein